MGVVNLIERVNTAVRARSEEMGTGGAYLLAKQTNDSDGKTPTAIDSAYNPERHLLIRFEPASGGLRPHGYSGATVWCDRAEHGAIWEPCPVLVGIQTHAYVKSGLVRAVRAGTIRQFLEESL